MQSRIDAIRSTYAPDQAVIIAAQWRHVEYYLPEYKTIRFGVVNRWEREGGLPIARPDESIEYHLSDLGLNPQGASVILFDPELVDLAEDPSAIDRGALNLLPWAPDRVLRLSPDTFGLR